MVAIDDEIELKNVTASSEVGIMKSYTLETCYGFFWTFSYISYKEHAELRSKFAQFDDYVFCLHIKKKKYGVYISLFRTSGNEDSTCHQLPGLYVQLSFSGGFVKSQNVFLTSTDISCKWYYQGLWDESQIHPKSPYLRRCTVYCKIIARNGVLNFPLPVYGTEKNVLISDTIPSNNSDDEESDFAVKFECEKISRALNFYKISEELKIPSLTEHCIDNLCSFINHRTCLYVLKNYRDLKETFIYQFALDLLLDLLKDICDTQELKQLKGGDMFLTCTDATSKESHSLGAAIQEPSMKGYLSCHSNDKGHCIWWTFPFYELFYLTEICGPTQYLEIEGAALYIYFHVVRCDSCILISVLRDTERESTLPHPYVGDLDVELSFLTVDDRPRKGYIYKTMNIWYTSYSLQDFVQPQSDFKSFSVVCKLSACNVTKIPHAAGIQNICNETSVNKMQYLNKVDIFGSSKLLNEVPISLRRLYCEEMCVDGILDSQEILFILIENGLLSTDKMLNIYRVAAKSKETNLMKCCHEYLSSEIDIGTCLTFLSKCQDMKDTNLFQKCIKLFVHFYDDVSVSTEWKELRMKQYRLFQVILKDAVAKGLSLADIMLSHVKKCDNVPESTHGETELDSAEKNTMKLKAKIFGK